MYGHTLESGVKALKGRRSGCLVYQKTGTGRDRSVDILFGVDSKSGELSDFGGGYEITDKNCITAAGRELYEESLYTIDIRNNLLLTNNYPCIWNDEDFIVFIESNDLDDIKTTFDHTIGDFVFLKPEMSGVEIVPMYVLRTILTDDSIRTAIPNIYTRPRSLLLETIEFWSRPEFFDRTRT